MWGFSHEKEIHAMETTLKEMQRSWEVGSWCRGPGWTHLLGRRGWQRLIGVVDESTSLREVGRVCLISRNLT